MVPHIPKTSRYTLGNKVDSLFLDTIELVFTASYEQLEEKIEKIGAANAKLGTLKFFLQIVWELKLIEDEKYIAISEVLDTIGRILGGWKRGLLSKLPAPTRRGK
ncbi:MAG: four helix bundle protein [Patescibacteria group bacterium]|nr:four helix bundle protein [Patescibacteria group bacterium]